MRIVFLSNSYNHHQSQLSETFYQLVGEGFKFIATKKMSIERIKLGYPVMSPQYVVEYQENISYAQKLIDDADILICGSAPENLLRERKQQRKVIFRYSERPLKKGFEWWKYLYRWFMWHVTNPKALPIYMLCASAYTAEDYSKFGMFKNRCFKWGYFPECKTYPDITDLLANKDKTEILWCGRFLDWKHPDDAVKVARKLKDEGYTFHMNFIGTGEMDDELRKMCSLLNLDDCVSFLGAMSPERVRHQMEKTGIYVFSSDRKEGWGAVLNEAMNSGCAVIASHEAGSTPYLINDKKNGFVYHSYDVDELFTKLKILLGDVEKQNSMGRAAYETIVREWNAKTAAERLVHISSQVLHNNKYFETSYETGPLSKA